MNSRSVQLHVVLDLDVASGGLGLAALQLASSVARAGENVILLYTTAANVIKLDVQRYAHPNLRLVEIPRGENFVANMLRCYGGLRTIFTSRKLSVVHLHGVWQPFFLLAAIQALGAKVPYVISPHGCFSRWALGHKSLKKKVALYAYQGFMNRRAAMFFATAAQEANDIHELGITRPVSIVPNGIELNKPMLRPERGSKRTLLFMSRIHPIKGLLDLVRAWAAIKDPSWQVVIAGPDECGHRAQVEAEIDRLGVAGDFCFRGMVHGAEKSACFADADLFILPTYSENFGIVIAEALAAGLPVITTTGAPWKDLEHFKCGWWVSPGVESLQDVLRIALNIPQAELEKMGARGREMVTANFDLDSIARKAIESYSKLVH
jgi:glycosyltransferase involved in cell wall biosynthesis